jgi:hypothetical protein
MPSANGWPNAARKGGEVPTKRAYTSWKGWGERNNETSARKRRLRKKLEDRGYGQRHGHGADWFYTGFSVTENETELAERERQVAYENRRYGG